MRGTPATRAADERLLQWLKLRAKGVTCAKIAFDYRVSRALVHQQTNGVLVHDIEHSGNKVRRHYGCTDIIDGQEREMSVRQAATGFRATALTLDHRDLWALACMSDENLVTHVRQIAARVRGAEA